MLSYILSKILGSVGEYFVYYLALSLGVGGIFFYQLCSVLFTWYSSRRIIDEVSTVRDLANESVYAEAQGKHYEFDGRRLRFYLVRDKLWVAADDLVALLQPPPDPRELRLLGRHYAELPGQGIKGISEKALLRMAHTRTAHRRATRDAIRFKAWLEKEALPNVKRLPSSFTAQVDGEGKKSA